MTKARQFDSEMKRMIHRLNLSWALDNVDEELANAARRHLSCEEFLHRLLAGEIDHRNARSVERKIRTARLHNQHYTLDRYDFAYPSKINAQLVRHLFGLDFIRQNKNIVFVGGVGLGKTHLAKALAYEACKKRHSVLCVPAMELINSLVEAASEKRMEERLRKYAKPELLVIDEFGYIPLDRAASELLFQMLARRYDSQCAPTIITTNRAFKEWPKALANDAVLASALLDRVLERCEVISIEGKSYRMRKTIETER